ncbi:glutamate receptor ionotropic, delta-2-like isoform X2 [Neocloeon triangulifer]|uniref:glutamate receptor ionotropic, delta-2-like isoform X2 n=1 Tax=Neocloeon triangulifer TaxID=2078957 RepID=UPI00286F4CA2|nr:glutamate receptor ionotropic, delta-2-like isoform X2 [Neocloeon triangulifer]
MKESRILLCILALFACSDARKFTSIEVNFDSCVAPFLQTHRRLLGIPAFGLIIISQNCNQRLERFLQHLETPLSIYCGVHLNGRSFVAVSDRDEVRFLRVYSATGGICEGSSTPEPINVAKCVKGQVKVFDEEKMRDPSMVNLQGCTVNVATIHFPPSVILFTDPAANSSFSAQMRSASSFESVTPLGGIEVSLMKSIGAAMNFRVRFYLPPDNQGWGVGKEDGTFSGLLGEVAAGRADVGIGCLMPLPLRTRFLLASRSYGHRGLAWAVPMPKPQPRWAVLVEAFAPDAWVAIAVVLVAALVLIMVANKGQITDGPFLYLWATTLGVSVIEMPRASWARVLLLGWLLAFLVLSAAYQGALFSYLTKARYEKSLDSLEDIVTRKLPIVGHPNFRGLLETGDERVSVEAQKLFEPSPDAVLGQMDVMARGGREVACLVNTEMLVWFNYQQRHSGHVVHIAKEMAISYPTSAFLRRSSTLVPRFDILVSRLVESGLTDKWYSDLSVRVARTQADSPQVLGIHNLSGIFMVHTVGMLLATAVFVVELAVDKWQRINTVISLL